MADNIETLLKKLIELRGPCKKLCDEGKVETLALIVDESENTLVDENDDYILWE